ncbi:hypothetical protein LZ32DRAFT_48281 [Colletotrichum eremochloae]|nr:hypothetical protein LZ32DRAFT_48281 [Colletotrichum eremochloae]
MTTTPTARTIITMNPHHAAPHRTAPHRITAQHRATSGFYPQHEPTYAAFFSSANLFHPPPSLVAPPSNARQQQHSFPIIVAVLTVGKLGNLGRAKARPISSPLPQHPCECLHNSPLLPTPTKTDATYVACMPRQGFVQPKPSYPYLDLAWFGIFFSVSPHAELSAACRVFHLPGQVTSSKRSSKL